MKISDKVSVIIPVYNAEKYLSHCIDSVLSQKDTDMEVIIINDGSTDQSESIIKRYLDDKRIVSIKQENSGVSAARNKGLLKATGEYIVFVDADDYLLPDTLGKRIELAKQADLLISSYSKLYADGSMQPDEAIQNPGNISKREALYSISPETTIGYQGFLWNKVFKRKHIVEHNIFFDASVAYGEDRLFVGQYILCCQSVLTDSALCYVYRQNQMSAMSAFKKIDRNNWRRIVTEFDGLHKIETIVKEYDEKLYWIFKEYEMAISLVFRKRAELSDTEIRNFCRENAVNRLKELILVSPELYSVRNKLKSIVRYLRMR